MTDNKSQNRTSKKEILAVVIPIGGIVIFLLAFCLSVNVIIPSVKKEVSYKKIVSNSISAGDKLYLGNDEWNNSWTVLKIEDSKALIINEECIELLSMNGNLSNYDPHLGRFFMTYPYVPQDAVLSHGEAWKHRGLKKWLNEEYYSYAFSDKEKELISESELGKVFILSASEAREYFSENSDRKAEYLNSNISWWLRSSTVYENVIYNDYVNYDGSINERHICDSGSNIGVRPAMWVNLSE